MRRKICVVIIVFGLYRTDSYGRWEYGDFKYGKWHLKYTLSTGSAEYIYQGKTVFDKVGTGVSGTYTEYEIGQERNNGRFQERECVLL